MADFNEFRAGFAENTRMTPEFWNKFIAKADLRLIPLEKQRESYDATIQRLRELTLQLLVNQLSDILPTVEEMTKLVAMMTFVVEGQSRTIDTGEVTFTLQPAEAAMLQGAGYVTTIPLTNSACRMTGPLVSVDVESGVITLNVVATDGAGTFSGWRIGVGVMAAGKGGINPRGEYDPEVDYVRFDAVYDPVTKSSYWAKVDDPGEPPGEDWQLYAQGASAVAADIAITPVGGVGATDVQAAIQELDAEKASLASPALTGTPTAPTATLGTNTTQIATTAFVKAALDALLGGAPGALDTLDELAAALNDDASFAATVTALIAAKQANLSLTGVADQTEAEAGSATDKAMTPQRTAQAIAAQAASVGDYKFASYLTPPTNYLLADGSALLQASYAALYAKIGNRFGLMTYSSYEHAHPVNTNFATVVSDGTRVHQIHGDGSTTVRDVFTTNATSKTTGAAFTTLTGNVRAAAYNGTSILLVTDDTTPKVYRVNVTTGTVTAVGSVTGMSSGDYFNGLLNTGTNVVAFGQNTSGNALIKTNPNSNDGVAWTSRTPNMGTAHVPVMGVSNGAGTVLLWTDEDDRFYRSTDHGVTWAADTTALDHDAGGMRYPVYLNGRFFFRADNHVGDGLWYSSTDGITWSATSWPGSLQLMSYGGGDYIFMEASKIYATPSLTEAPTRRETVGVLSAVVSAPEAYRFVGGNLVVFGSSDWHTYTYSHNTSTQFRLPDLSEVVSDIKAALSDGRHIEMRPYIKVL